jgi:ribosome-binding ATPase YchF (GTP1/OBG family)
MLSEEAKEWLEMLGVEPGEGGGLGALIRATYKTLGLQTYFTTGACWAVALPESLQLVLLLDLL